MSAKPLPPPSVNEAETLMRKARSRGHGRRSPIMTWMQQNRQELEAAFARTAPAWSVLATYLGKHGITDGDGKAPTARATRGAWARVKALPVLATPTSIPVPASPAKPGAEAAPSIPPAPRSVEEEPPRRTYNYVVPRGLDPDAKAPTPPPAPPTNAETPTPAVPAVNVYDVLAKFAPGITRR